MARLNFRPAAEDRIFDVELTPVTSLLVALMKAGAPIRHDCGGRALCGTCRVELGAARSTSPLKNLERARLVALNLPLDGSVRLACQVAAFRDLEAQGLVAPAAEEGR